MRLFGSCLLFSGLVANAENNYYQNLIDIYNQLNHIDGHIGDVNRDNNLYYSQIVQLLEQLNGVSNGVVASPDVLAGNPWWATNSAFVLTKPQISLAYPDEVPESNYSFSFPQFMSKWSSFLTYPQNNGGHPTSYSDLLSSWHGYFGTGRFNSRAAPSNIHPYTWFDWVSDMMRSNAVVRNHLAAYTSQSEAEQSLTSLDQSTAEEFATNAPPSVDPFEIEMPPGLTGFQTVSDAFGDFIADLNPSLSGANSAIQVLPSFSLGGISSPSMWFDFNNPLIVPYCRAVMSFLWAVLCGSMMFRLLSGEWAYYTSLGRTTH